MVWQEKSSLRLVLKYLCKINSPKLSFEPFPHTNEQKGESIYMENTKLENCPL